MAKERGQQQLINELRRLTQELRKGRGRPGERGGGGARDTLQKEQARFAKRINSRIQSQAATAAAKLPFGIGAAAAGGPAGLGLALGTAVLDAGISAAKGAARQAGQFVAGSVASATDPRDITGIGSTQALNNILDSIGGQTGGNILRNLTGLTELQAEQNTVENRVKAVIRSNSEAGLSTPIQQIQRAAEQAREIAAKEAEGLKAAKADPSVSAGFSALDQSFKVLKSSADQAAKGLRDMSGKIVERATRKK